MEKKTSTTAIIKDIKKESNNKKTDYQKTIELLLDDNYKRRKTNINAQQVSIINTLDVIAQSYDIGFLKLWVDGFGEWRTSINGKGREDIVKIGMAQYEEMRRKNDELIGLLGMNR